MKKIQSFLFIIFCIIIFGACDFFSGGGASITVSLDADSLRKFVNENLSSQPVIKGHYEGEGADSLSLKVILSGDETGVWTSEIPDKPNYRSNVSVKVDGLRVGAKIKVRVDLVRNVSEIVISGGTKSFRVSGGDNNVPIAMGNYSDIIVWNVNGAYTDYSRGEIDGRFVDVMFNISHSAITFDAVNNSLHITGNSNWYNTSWRKTNLSQINDDYIVINLNHDKPPVIAAYNGYLYYYEAHGINGFHGQGTSICRFKWDTTDYSDGTTFKLDTAATGFVSTTEVRADALAFSPDGNRAYLAYTVEISDTDYKYEYYIMSLDTSNDDEWKVISKIEIAPSGNFLGSGINAKDAGGSFHSDGFKIADMRVQEGYLWVLVRENKGSTGSGISRGALMRYDLSLGSRKVFGWTGDKQGPRVTGGYYRTPPTKDSTNFFGPLKFIAVRPDELVIADDGIFIDTQRNRIIFFDIEKEAVSNIYDLDEHGYNYEFDGTYSNLSLFPN